MSYLKTYNKLMEQYQGGTAYSQQELEDIIADLSGLLDNPATKLTREQIVTKLKGYINMLNNTPENLNNLAYLAQGEDEETIAESKKKQRKTLAIIKQKLNTMFFQVLMQVVIFHVVVSVKVKLNDYFC